MVKDSRQTIITDPETKVEKAFTFDYSYNSFADLSDPEHASQDTVWDDIGVKVSSPMRCRSMKSVVCMLINSCAFERF